MRMRMRSMKWRVISIPFSSPFPFHSISFHSAFLACFPFMTDRTVDSIVPSASKVTVDGPEGSSDAVLTVSDPRLVRRAAALPRGPFRQEVNVAFRAITNLQALERDCR